MGFSCFQYVPRVHYVRLHILFVHKTTNALHFGKPSANSPSKNVSTRSDTRKHIQIYHYMTRCRFVVQDCIPNNMKMPQHENVAVWDSSTPDTELIP